jgi:ribulose-phosphate 3-epimerase
MLRISASLLAADHARLGEEVRRGQAAGVDAFHFDLMDGHYVPNLALSPRHLAALRPHTELPFHVHLELANPDAVLMDFPELRADLIFVQWDTLQTPEDTFARIRDVGARVGLSLNPGDPLEPVHGLLGELDMLLLLSVHPGFGGQKMVFGTMARVAQALDMIAETAPGLPLAVDGGIQEDSALQLGEMGVSWVVIGTALYGQRDMTGFVAHIKGESRR